MILEIIFALLSIAVNSVITYFTGMYDRWWFDLIMVILLPLTYVLVFAIYLGFVAIASLFMYGKKEINKPKYPAAWFVKETYKVILDLARIKVIRTGMENVPKDQKYLIVANHRSNFDPFPVSYYFDGNVANVTKPENMTMPVYGNYIKYCAFVPMPRDDDFAAVKAIVRSTKIIKEQNSNMAIFPEGKRNKTDAVLLDFHAGSFKIATKAKCPLIIVSLTNTDQIKNNWPWKRTTIYMDVVKVYSPEELEGVNTNELASESMRLIKEKYLSRKEGK